MHGRIETHTSTFEGIKSIIAPVRLRKRELSLRCDNTSGFSPSEFISQRTVGLKILTFIKCKLSNMRTNNPNTFSVIPRFYCRIVSVRIGFIGSLRPI